MLTTLSHNFVDSVAASKALKQINPNKARPNYKPNQTKPVAVLRPFLRAAHLYCSSVIQFRPKVPEHGVGEFYGFGSSGIALVRSWRKQFASTFPIRLKIMVQPPKGKCRVLARVETFKWTGCTASSAGIETLQEHLLLQT